MTSAGLISVIVPAYNAERFLAATLASVQAQTYRNIEIIVVDDGSTDSTRQIVEDAARSDDRIRLIRQQNLGVALARNAALAEARGEFVAPIDADDLWHPQNLSLQVAALQKAGPHVAVSYAWFVTIDENGKFCGKGPEIKFAQKQDVLSAQLKGNFIGNASSTVMRKEAVNDVGGYDSSLRARGAEGCEDQALYISLAQKWDYAHVPHYLIAYRIHELAMSQDDVRMALSQAFVLADLHRHRPGRWFGRGIARVYEGQLITAILQRRWDKIADVVRKSGSISRSGLIQLLLLRLPIRATGFVLRRVRKRAGLSEPVQNSTGAFWHAEDGVSCDSFPDQQARPKSLHS